MKTMKEKGIVLLAAIALMAGGCKVKSDTADASSGGGGGGGVIIAAAFPTAADGFEGSAGDNTKDQPSSILVGGLQTRTIYPQGDEDWVKVALVSGKTYELFATNLNYTADTVIELYKADGVTLVASNDNFLSFDSNIDQITITETGNYLIHVYSYYAYDMASYQLGVRLFIDSDNDGYSATYDCNDSNNAVYPYTNEIAGNGIDEDCSGADAPSGTDGFEPDGTLGGATTIYSTKSAVGEIIYQSALYTLAHTIDPGNDTDYYKVTLPPHAAAYVVDYSQGPAGLQTALLDNGGAALGITDSKGPGGIIEMSTPDAGGIATTQTYYLEVMSENGSSTTWYAPALVPIGTDSDGDGFYTQDWSPDCDDTNALIYPGATERPLDPKDWDCDGDPTS
ncbi:putative metal-binding motif-containing protein [Sulfurimonas sp. HSL1-6]|uniref:putative metal-binding motif-containing protein n=1 Tax=Thiomicrolovo immobilis TaxID=3131935 RepID=UPI0031F81B9F